MTPLTPHFSLEEMTVTDVHYLDNTPSEDIVIVLRSTASQMEEVRLRLGSFPIHINSGYRSPEVNARVGGVENSAHITGHACDFICPNFGAPLDICRALSTGVLCPSTN